MSLTQLRRFIRQRVVRVTLWGSIFLIFLVGTFVSFGTVRRASFRPTPPSVVAKVNGWKISRSALEERIRSELMGGGHNVRTWVPMKYSILDRMIDEILLMQAARKQRVKASRRDIHERINRIVEEQMSSQRREFRTLKEFTDWIRSNYGSVNAYKEKLRDELLDHRSAIELEVLREKLRKSIESTVKVSEEDVKEEYCKVKLRHIMVSYDRFMKGKLNPSPKERETAAELAEKEASRLKELLREGKKFEELAKAHSDDEATKGKGGDLGWVELNQIKFMFGEEVAKAALRTTIGKPAGPIKGITGYHIIVVEGRKFDFPPKYYKARYRCLSCCHQWEVEDERKAKPTKCPKCNGKRLKVVWRGSKEVLEDVRRVKVERAWFEFQSKMRADAKIEILDPELAAYKAEVYGDTKEAIRLYNKALKYAETLEVPLVFPAAILFRIGLLYERQKGKEELALKAYRRALSYDEDAVLHIRIAMLLKSKGKKEEALRELKKASEVVGDPSDRIELARLYEELGMKAEAERQRKLYESEMKERFSGGSM